MHLDLKASPNTSSIPCIDSVINILYSSFKPFLNMTCEKGQLKLFRMHICRPCSLIIRPKIVLKGKMKQGGQSGWIIKEIEGRGWISAAKKFCRVDILPMKSSYIKPRYC